MPSARQIEIEQPSGEQTRTDLHSMLQDIRASNISNLNSLHRRGKVLFSEGEPARGIYILRTGRASVSITSSEGKVVILRMAEAGDVLGLNSVLRGCSYDATVKTLDPCRTDFIARSEVIDLLETQAGAKAMLALLSGELSELNNRTRSLLLPQTASGRLAKLLLDWSQQNGSNTSSGEPIDKAFTHEEIAQMICSSRETVTRLLASMSRRQIIQVNSGNILIRDREALEAVAVS
ncbi:MAG TPA: Crp/Fnr family transcriptional regulator [Pyrinomonadaceae bacterium]|nr:Crp/Fnr family transcriptional regulator [Pyrinomonadaceae bacterium]